MWYRLQAGSLSLSLSPAPHPPTLGECSNEFVCYSEDNNASTLA